MIGKKQVGKKKTWFRACDQCGRKIEYAAEACDVYLNSFHKECLTAPKNAMIVVSIPTTKGREFFDFCGMKCFRFWVISQILNEEAMKNQTEGDPQ